MRRLLATLMAACGALALTTASFAASITFDGNWRVGYRLFDALDLNQNEDFDTDGDGFLEQDNRSFVLHRLRLNPVINITDDLGVYFQTDILTGRYRAADSGGAAPHNLNFTGGAYWGSPAVAQGGDANFAREGQTGARGLFAGDFSQFSNERNGEENFLVRRVWGEWATDYGTLRAGRMPRHFGLGMWWNDGNRVWDYFQDTVDTVNFEASFGNLTFVPFYDIINEDDRDDHSRRTTNSGVWAIYNWLDHDLEAGLMYYFFHKANNNIAAHIFDGYVDKTFPNLFWNGTLRTAVEAVWIFGPQGFAATGPAPTPLSEVDANKFGLAAEADYARGKLDVWGRAGYASGQPPHAGDADEDREFVFDRNYNIALIMFEQGVGRLPLGFGELNAGSNEYQNTIHNTVYAALGASYDLWKDLWVSLNGVWGYAAERASTDNAQNLNRGFELDGSAGYQWTKNIATSLDAGILFPGEFYKGNAVQNFQTNEVLALAFNAAVTF
ncbi:MAG: hypothetical protein HY391_05165 [Deltaproteobacteria bacterium]|nr:hypothetical protein [Deltaproteobacteria bacterium]